jgi:hypothetical protein
MIRIRSRRLSASTSSGISSSGLHASLWRFHSSCWTSSARFSGMYFCFLRFFGALTETVPFAAIVEGSADSPRTIQTSSFFFFGLRSHIFSQKDHNNNRRIRSIRAKRQEETFFIKMDGPLSSSANNQRQARPFQDVTNQANGLRKEESTTNNAPHPAIAWQLYHYPHLLLPRRDSNDQENWTSPMTYERSTSLLSVS